MSDQRAITKQLSCILYTYTLQQVKGNSNPTGGHLTFISQWSLTKCRYNYTSNKNVHVGMAVANKARKQVWKLIITAPCTILHYHLYINSCKLALLKYLLHATYIGILM